MVDKALPRDMGERMEKGHVVEDIIIIHLGRIIVFLVDAGNQAPWILDYYYCIVKKQRIVVIVVQVDGLDVDIPSIEGRKVFRVVRDINQVNKDKVINVCNNYVLDIEEINAEVDGILVDAGKANVDYYIEV